MVDGAHQYLNISFQMKVLDCDYYGASRTKWLSVPFGSGMLYIKKEKIDSVWPLQAERDLEPNDIHRLNHIGTHPVHTDLGILNAIEYQNALGLKRKEARLKYLQNYWTSQLRELPRIIVNTPVEMSRHGGIGNVGIEDIEPADLAKTLLDKYQIWTVAINRPGVRGLRITPNVYTTTSELDSLVRAIKELSG